MTSPEADYEYQDFKMREVKIESEETHWNEYKLEDGTILRVKLVVMQAGKSIDKPLPDSGGEPVYHIKTQTVVNAEVPKDQYMEVEEEEGKE